MKYGFIGFGNLAKAIHAGLAENEALSFGYVTKGEGPEDVTQLKDIPSLVESADVILLCVKPQNASEVLEVLKCCDLMDKLVVSPMAGKTISFIEGFVGEKVPIVRIMPNLAVAYRHSVTAFTTNAAHSPHENALKENLRALGKVVELEEKHFDLFTAVFGSGPAFILKVLEVMQERTRELGVSNSQANELISELLTGTAHYLDAKSDKGIDALISAITSKGGTTEAGLRVFEEKDLDDLFKKVITAAEERSRELSS